jgi:tRNA(Ile)-lysidine synthase
VAFSGGPDSLALAAALSRARPRLAVDLHLVHVDHALDGASGARAEGARELAAALDLPFHLELRAVHGERRPGENLEAASRRVRYDALEQARRRIGADCILTAHHRDDQIETVLLRIRSGSSIFGLTGIRERSGALWRPALRRSRRELAAIVASSGLQPVLDPSNADVARDRNRIRHRLLPHLLATEPAIDAALAELAERAAGARAALTRRLERAFRIRVDGGRWSLARVSLDFHPPLLGLFALQVLESFAGFGAPSSTSSRRELLRQVRAADRERLPGPGGRIWRLSGDRLELLPAGECERKLAPFSYTSRVPGEVEVPELGGRLRLTPSAVESWMLRGEPDRAALCFGGSIPASLEVRNRRPGDRLRPLGAPGMRSLKELLIDRKVPRAERDRVPLLVVDGRIAWVPGITIEDDLRLRGEGDCWVAEWLPDANQGAGDPRSTFTRDPGPAAMPPEEGKR